MYDLKCTDIFFANRFVDATYERCKLINFLITKISKIKTEYKLFFYSPSAFLAQFALVFGTIGCGHASYRLGAGVKKSEVSTIVQACSLSAS